MGADIAFEDEAGVGVMTRHGRTWGMSGETPVIKASMLRGGYNVLSAVTAEGEMDYSIQDGTVNGERYIGFLGGLIADRKRPLIVLADHATFHHSKQVRDYVRAHRANCGCSSCRSGHPNTIRTNRFGTRSRTTASESRR